MGRNKSQAMSGKEDIHTYAYFFLIIRKVRELDGHCIFTNVHYTGTLGIPRIIFWEVGVERFWLVFKGAYCLSQENMSRKGLGGGTYMERYTKRELNCGDLV